MELLVLAFLVIVLLLLVRFAVSIGTLLVTFVSHLVTFVFSGGKRGFRKPAPRIVKISDPPPRRQTSSRGPGGWSSGPAPIPGSGFDKPPTCGSCDGSGWVSCYSCDGSGWLPGNDPNVRDLRDSCDGGRRRCQGAGPHR
jgi:hypothetical protein